MESDREEEESSVETDTDENENSSNENSSSENSSSENRGNSNENRGSSKRPLDSSSSDSDTRIKNPKKKKKLHRERRSEEDRDLKKFQPSLHRNQVDTSMIISGVTVPKDILIFFVNNYISATDPKTFSTISNVNYLFYTLTKSATALKNLVIYTYFQEIISDNILVREIPSDDILARSNPGFKLHCTLCNTWTITYPCENECDTHGCATCIRNTFRSCSVCGIRKCSDCFDNEDFGCHQCEKDFCCFCGGVHNLEGTWCDECFSLCLKCVEEQMLTKGEPKEGFCLEGHCQGCDRIVDCEKCLENEKKNRIAQKKIILQHWMRAHGYSLKDL